MAAAQTRITFCAATDKLHWDTDLSQTHNSTKFIDAYADTNKHNHRDTSQFSCECGCTIAADTHQHSSEVSKMEPRRYENNYKKPHSQPAQRIIPEPTSICCDCGCMIEDINEVCIRTDRKFASRRRSRSRNRLVRQYTAPAIRCR